MPCVVVLVALVLGRIMLPMVLKRYEAEEMTPHSSPTSGGGGGGGSGGWSPGQPKKSDRKVIVPHRLDVSNFMAPSGGTKVSSTGSLLLLYVVSRGAGGRIYLLLALVVQPLAAHLPKLR